MLPEEPLSLKTPWKCQMCNFKVSCKQVGFVSNVVGSRLNSFQADEVDEMLTFLKKKILPDSNHIMVELKLKIIWIVGCTENYCWKDIPDELLYKKESLCREMLNLLETLKTGRCKIRGLLLYEIVCCLQENHRRIKLQMQPVETNNNYSISEVEMKEIEMFLKEASEILMFDVSAPTELKAASNYK